MEKLTRENLYSLEKYAEIRSQFRAQIMAHKKERKVPIGPHATLYFEDRLTIQYQIQEMLRIERIFESDGIQEELDVYNPLIPDGTNWKATFMIEYEDAKERRQALSRLIGIERCIQIKVEGFESVKPIANENLERETGQQTSSVHFLRFELTPEMLTAAKGSAAILAKIEHPAYSYQTDPFPEPTRVSLLKDLD